jgi:F-type H+-transporting ATPase subunit b
MEGHHGGILDISWQILLVEWVCFMLLFFILTKILFKPITKFLNTRSNEINNTYKKMDETRAELDKMKQKYQAQLNELSNKTDAIVQQAIKEAEEKKQEIISKAKEEASQMLERASVEIERERKKAITELHKEVSELSILCASKIIEKSIDTSVAEKLVEETIDNLEKQDIHLWSKYV